MNSLRNKLSSHHATAVAIAYHLQKTPYVFPVIGGRKVGNLQKNLEALTITLSPEQMELLESALPFDAGFPYWLIVSAVNWLRLRSLVILIRYQGDGTEPVGMLATSVEVDFWPKAGTIKPGQHK